MAKNILVGKVTVARASELLGREWTDAEAKSYCRILGCSRLTAGQFVAALTEIADAPDYSKAAVKAVEAVPAKEPELELNGDGVVGLWVKGPGGHMVRATVEQALSYALGSVSNVDELNGLLPQFDKACKTTSDRLSAKFEAKLGKFVAIPVPAPKAAKKPLLEVKVTAAQPAQAADKVVVTSEPVKVPTPAKPEAPSKPQEPSKAPKPAPGSCKLVVVQEGVEGYRDATIGDLLSCLAMKTGTTREDLIAALDLAFPNIGKTK